MQIPTKKLKNGFELPIYGLGTWSMGGKHEHNPDNDDAADIEYIQSAIEHGITHIDTAESYAEGYTETLVGKAIQNYERNQLFLASKVHAEHLGYDDLIHSVQASLKRLQASWLDICFAHRYSLTIPVKETMQAMDTLMEVGLIRNIGVSNYTPAEIEEAQSYTKNKIVAVQNHYNLQIRESVIKGVLEYCQNNDIFFIAWRPLKGIRINASDKLIDSLVKKYNKTYRQIALNWLIAQDNVVIISKTRTDNHLEENLGAIGWTMEKSDRDMLGRKFPNQQALSDTVQLHFT